MYKDKKILAIVPSRGNSKGLPGKNIKPLIGKPLISWTIEQGLNSKYIDKLIVSTDNDKIAKVSKEYGAEVPFIRPDFLANDNASSIDVIFHCISYLENKNEFFDFIVFLEPTSPLRDTEDIDKSIELLENTENAESIVGISRVESAHPDFLVSLNDDFLVPYKKEIVVKRRQDVSKLYFFEGSIYISIVQSLKDRKVFYHDKCLGYVVPKWKAFEIDDICDFYIIEALMQKKIDGYLK